MNLSQLPQGYCVSPNNIIGAAGCFIYAAGPGVFEPKGINNRDINLRPDGSIAVGWVHVIGEHYTNTAKLVFDIAEEFKNKDEFSAFYATAGEQSGRGAPAGSCGTWD